MRLQARQNDLSFIFRYEGFFALTKRESLKIPLLLQPEKRMG